MSRKQSRSSSSDKPAFSFPVRLELVTVLSLLSLILLLRTFQLGADPPLDVSVSSDVYTDPPQYVHFAKSYVQTGNSNPFNDPRFVPFLKSTVTVAATAVFGAFGVGRSQANAVGLFFSFGSLFLFFLFLRRVAGPLTGVLFLFLICFDYSQLFYGRLPFLENAMTFFAFLAVVLTFYLRNWWGIALAGASLAVGIFFGKVIGIIFLAPFAALFFYRITSDPSDDKPGSLSPQIEPLWFAGGFMIVALFWLLYAYLPMQDQVSGYLGEKAVGLYGAPAGLESFSNFVQQLVTFGYVSKLFVRMRVVAVIGASLLLVVGYQIWSKEYWRSRFDRLKSGQLFLAIMIVSFVGALMIWNYRPLRYQLVLIYAFYGAAAISLSWLCHRLQVNLRQKTPYTFYLFAYPVVLVTCFQFLRGLARFYSWDFYFDERVIPVALGAAVITVALGYFVARVRSWKAPGSMLLARQGFVALVLIGTSIFGLLDFLNWSKRPTFMAQQDGADLEMILSPDAILSGPYAPQLTLDTRLESVIHMFGVSEADRELFEKFPVTHLLVDKDNEKRARKDYPNVMDSAVHVCTYHIGLKKTRLFRIAGHTGNRTADAYVRSDFEEAVDFYNADSVMAGNECLKAFLAKHPENSTAYLMMAERSEAVDYNKEAEVLFKKAVEFSPTNYDLNARLAKFLKDQYEETSDLRYKTEGLKYFEAAILYAPTVNKIAAAYRDLKGN